MSTTASPSPAGPSIPTAPAPRSTCASTLTALHSPARPPPPTSRAAIWSACLARPIMAFPFPSPASPPASTPSPSMPSTARRALPPLCSLGLEKVNNAAPVGHVDVVNFSMVAGWARRPRPGLRPHHRQRLHRRHPLHLRLRLPRRALTSPKPFGSPNHGFAVDLSSLPPGSHSVTVTAVDNRTSDENEVVIFDDFINNHTPIGSIDLISGGKSPAGPTTRMPATTPSMSTSTSMAPSPKPPPPTSAGPTSTPTSTAPTTPSATTCQP